MAKKISRTYRPLSPHLSIYRIQITSAFSVLHRLSELSVYASAFALVSLMGILCIAPQWQQFSITCLFSLPGRALIVVYTAGLSYHFCSSFRYLFWDIGKGFALPQVYATAWICLAGTLLVWGACLMAFYQAL